MLSSSCRRFAFAATAAFRTSAKGGLIPQAKQGGNGKASVAMVGSKFDGTGFENEHIGQTQVPIMAGNEAETLLERRNGLADLEDGEDEEASR